MSAELNLYMIVVFEMSRDAGQRFIEVLMCYIALFITCVPTAFQPTTFISFLV
jgi:hypothetical protein